MGAAALLVIGGARGAHAQACGDVPTGLQTYFVLGHEQHVWDMMNRVRLGEGGGAFSNGVNSIVSSVSSADLQIIYYDHWEDGYEANPQAPVQASTLVLGDGDIANGRACDWTNDPRVFPCDGTNDDTLFRGTAITLNSDQGLGGCAAGVRCSVPVNPRGVAPGAAVRFDGGDLIVTSGGPLSVIHSQDPLNPFIGGATEMLSMQATANATAFTVPVGENLYAGNGSVTEIFQYVDVDIVAYQDNTQVFVNSPFVSAAFPGGTASFTLNRGQHWSSRGFIHGGTVATAAPAVQVNAGTRISTTGPLTGLIFTAGDGTYSTDFFPLLPDLLHTTDYTLPVPGNVPSGSGASATNVYIFNPNPLTAISVTASDSLGTTTFAVPANGFLPYSDPAAMNRFPPSGSTVRLTANRAFWGVAVIDHTNVIADWGYSWLGNRFLTNTYTCSSAPGVDDPPINSAPAQRIALGGFPANPDPQCTIPPSGAPGACDSANRQPVWVAATQNNTRVRIDLDNDGLYDLVDTDSDDCPDQGQATDPACAPIPSAYVGACGLVAGPANCVYTINAGSAPRFLNVYDYTDYDNTGTFIVGDKPVAVAYGQDSEQTVTGETFTVDTGYVIFPLVQAFLDPVLVLDKTSDRNTVPATGGGQIVYTLTLRSYSLPMTDVRLSDLLPPLAAGDASAPAYVPGSTLITFPDLSQSTVDPEQVAVGSRTQLHWPALASPAFSMPPNATLTIRYAVNIPTAGNPLGPATAFSNSGAAMGRSGASTFSPQACATVVRTNVTLTKTVLHDGTPEVGDGTPAAGEPENLTYGLTLQNVDETGVMIVDLIPPDTTFAGGIVSPAPFTGAAAGRFDPVQNAVVWGPATLTSAMGPLTLGFQVAINPGVAVGTSIGNRGQFESTTTPVFYSNEVLVTVVGASLTAGKTASVATALPGQTFTFEVQVQNDGTAPADNLLMRDPFPNNALYVPGTLEWRLNAGAFQPLTDQADADQGTIFADRIEFGGVGAGVSLGVTQTITIRFQARVTGTGGQFVNNQATVGSNEVSAFFTNLVQIPIVGDAVVNGRLFLDLDSDGNIDPGEAGIPNVDVVVTAGAVVLRVTTDSNGNYTVTVPAGPTSLNVDETDPDFPAGAVITTGAPPRPPGNDTQTVTAVSGGTINPATAGCGVALPPYCAVGYFPGNITVIKRSNGNNELSPGQVVSYTVTIRNNSAVTQNDVTLSDAVPAGMTFVAGSTQIQRRGPNPVFRVTEVQVPAGCAGGAFGGTDCTLNVLAAGTPVSANYFAIVQGSSAVADGGANVDYARVTNDFAGTGDFAGGGGLASHQLQLTRSSTTGDWAGVVTVVECLTSCDTAGFRLRSVEDVTHAAATSTGTDTSTTAWTDVNQVMLMGGFNGAGCLSANATDLEHPVCHARFTPSGTNTINWTRATPSALTLATSTVYAVEWGTQWNVQHVRVTGTAGGDNLDLASEYNGAVLPQNVARDNTWLWATGFAAGNTGNIGTQAEAAIATLGNGQVENAIEGRVAVGTEFNGTPVDFEVWALTHPDLRTDWVKRAQADAEAGGIATITVATAAAGTRMALAYNGNSGTTDDYPSPILNARYTAATTITLNRRRTVGVYPAWVQGIDFANVREVLTSAGNDATNLVTAANDIDLAAGETATVTFQMRVDDPLAAGISSVTNTANGASVESAGPFPDSVTDAVLRPAVVVEYDNAGFASSPGSVLYSHLVTNTGARPDSFVVTAISETNPLIPAGWTLELINPTTGAVIATDSDGNGAWDGGVVINTGLLDPGQSLEYQLRVTAPAGFAVGTQQTARLRARSDRQPSLFDDAVDETTILGATDVGPVILIPDNSGVVVAGGRTVYTHRVINNTGATDTFDLRADSSQAANCASTQPPRDPACWFAAIYYDSNGDGAYTPGVDLQIANTAQLAAGASQTFFVVVEARTGALGGEVDVTHLTATSRNDTNQFDGATDTTTVVVSGMDLSGGGSLLLTQGAVGVFPGTLLNQGTATDRFNFELTPSSLFGLDSLNHPTELWIDVNGDGSYAPSEFAGADTDGDGDWDTFGPAFDGDGDFRPDVQLAAGAQVAYELRRQVDPLQRIGREFATLTARSAGSSDSVTATNLLAAVTRATVRGVRVDRSGGVIFATGRQHGTAGFELYVSEGPRGARRRLTEETVASPVPDTMAPVVYKVRTAAVSGTHLWIEEIETDGDRRLMGPFPIGDRPLERALARVETRLEAAGVGDAPVRRAFTAREKRPKRRARRAPEAALMADDADTSADDTDEARAGKGGATVGARLEVSRAGRVEVSLDELRDRGVPHVPARQLRITSAGQNVPFEVLEGGAKIRFLATELSTDYTGRNAYVVSAGAPRFGMEVPLTTSRHSQTPGSLRVERSWIYLANAPEATDPWLWDLVLGDGSSWPYDWWDPTAGDFDLPGLSATAGPVRIRLTGYSNHRHAVTASINGQPVGSVTFTGVGSAVLTGSAPDLRPAGNQLTLTYTSALEDGTPDPGGLIYLDYLEVEAPAAPPVENVEPDAIAPWRARVATSGRVEYLIVTHPRFRGAARRIAEAKEAQGLKTRILRTDRVYDRFSQGIPEANAIKAAIQLAARRSRSLKYVLLIGDDTFDTHDYLGTGAESLVPSLLARDGEFGRVPSENRYADLDGDGAPDLAIGRLPVQTVEQAEALADKIATQESVLAAYATRHLFAVDNDLDSDAPFRAEADAVATRLGAADRAVADVGQGVSVARDVLASAWGSGAAFSHYFGHGGVDVWGDERLLAVEDVDGLTIRPTVLLAWACESQWYLNLFGPAINEALVLKPGGGAVATFGPVGISSPAHQKALYDAFYGVLAGPRPASGLTLGEAVRRAKAAAAADPQRQPAIDGFGLLGDPALTLP